MNYAINADWKPAGNRIKTKWGKNLDYKKVWQEYPRPQLQRSDWMNLNGLWSYAIKDQSVMNTTEFDGLILVPFPVESSLSGVMKNLSQTEVLFYEKSVRIPDSWKGKNVLLNFGAVDWKCEVFVNKVKVGEHTGGYSYFYFDITKYLKGTDNTITLRVTDVTDTYHPEWGKYQPVGKQTVTPNGIWYTPSSGVWQTAWLEPVSPDYIEKVEINNDFDGKKIKVNFKVPNDAKLSIDYIVSFDGKSVAYGRGKSNEEIAIDVSSNFKPWSPSEPNLYTITAELTSSTGVVVDKIASYTAVRKVESKKDKNGILRIFLNNKPLFNVGPLDQGYWPDGLYTPPSEEAMLFDIQTMKNLGFNTMRKHAKTESFRYYYNCDKLGMLVWQDMPSGNVDGSGSWDSGKMDGGSDTKRTDFSKENYRREWVEIIENLKFFQCIIIWTPFNEAWGQFQTESIVKLTRQTDNTRLVNAASGGNHRKCSDFVDIHPYPDPRYFFKYDSLINVIGEFGGLGLEIKNHTWKDNNWSYYMVKNEEELTGNYTVYINRIKDELVSQGISAAIYTQVTDCEGEINGLMTYDRFDIKIYDSIKKVNEELIASL
ncbi:MAG: beta-galactosidase, partial [Clostridia bacterium]|nr:beta-galactosidase [Clostridia bacterium]